MSKPKGVSTDINDYTYAELLLILELNDNEARDTTIIRDKTNAYIERAKKENNQKMEKFFMDVQKTLLQNAEKIGTEGGTEGETSASKQTQNWIENAGGLPQKNTTQMDKITDRFQKIDVYDNKHVPMEQEQLGINNTYNVDVAQDGKLNPTLKNTNARMVVVDSFFRQESASGNISTDFTLDLSDRLTKVLSLRLWSIQVPLTYYVIDDVYGNTCFWITEGEYHVPVSIPPGNYSPADFVTALTTAFGVAGFTFTGTPVLYNTSNYKLTLSLEGGTFTPPPSSSVPPFVISTLTQLTFFNVSGPLVCKETCIPQAMHVNETLGWVMGFHNTSGVYNVEADGNVGESVLDLSGTRYLILVIDDFAQNHLNNGLITITEQSKVVKLPDYYTTDHPFFCESEDGNQVPQLTPSAPRTLTQNQIYTINEILKNNANNLSTRAKAPTTNNVFAILPVKSQAKGTLYVDFSGQLQENKRIYFGPVDIERLRVRLLDDKGNTLNLNGGNWSITLLSELLYQY